MKNLFDYATKELSQDAILRWIFENYDDSDVGEVAYTLLKRFCALKENEKIVWLGTTAQWINIDISIWIDTDAGRKLALFIEDKTYSNEHNQLIDYDKRIDDINDREVYKIFYKTSVVDDRDKQGINFANESNKNKWIPFGINEIAPLFKPFSQSNNLIIAQYVEHLDRIVKVINNTEKPKSSDTKIDFLAWQSYLNDVIIPKLNGNGSLYWCGAWKVGQYPYVVLYIKKLGYGGRNIPYLEIRSRDCCDDSFMARLLCYGVEDSPQNRECQNRIIDEINQDKECLLSTKGIVKYKNGKQIFPKQIGVSPKYDNVKTTNEFIALLQTYIEKYIKLMTYWK